MKQELFNTNVTNVIFLVINAINKDKQTKTKLIIIKQQMQLNTTETTFNHLHNSYNYAKATVETLKKLAKHRAHFLYYIFKV